ncbi:hypothetical protein HHI36_023408 [Cryptolaemus montrouzieri]|uniref:Endonuclease/exonuclease/phosphatase domain-containing protein n=1 Tax=Cryptolaemus montrouzieri TaxID=559131 RepID=A0ABD2PH15_9CUCU
MSVLESYMDNLTPMIIENRVCDEIGECDEQLQVQELDGIKVIRLIIKDVELSPRQILALYRYPSLNIASFVDGLKAFFDNCSDVFGTTILIGDLNIDLMVLDDLGREYLNIFSESGYKSAINTPTRVQGNHSSCIDYIVINSNMPEDKLCPIVWRSGLTGHYSVLLGIHLAEKLIYLIKGPSQIIKK